MTDHDLLSRYTATGDPAAFELLVRRHLPLVHAAASRLAGPSADDVTQAVFLLLSQKARSLSSHPSIVGWLHRATRFASANARKIESRRRRHEQEAARMKPDTQLPSNETADIRPHLDAALAALGPRDRTAVLLRYLEGLSIEDTARALNLAPDAAAKRAQRGLARLRAYFTAHKIAIPAAAVVAALTAESTRAVPLALITQTSALPFAAAAAPAVVTLTKGTATMMLIAKLKLAAIAAAVALTATLTTSYLIAQNTSPPVPTPAAVTAPTTPPAPSTLAATAPRGFDNPGNVLQTVGIFDKISSANDPRMIRAEGVVDPAFPVDAYLKQFRALKNPNPFDIANARALDRDAIVLTTKITNDPAQSYIFRLRKNADKWQIVSADLLPAEDARTQFEAFLRQTAGTSPAATTAPDSGFDPLVADLLLPARRDAAARKLLSRWDAAHEPMVDNLGVAPVRQVIVCPQLNSPPLFVVFLTARNNAGPGNATGPAALVDSRGNYVSFQYFTRGECLLDINDDGVLDRVSSYSAALGGNANALSEGNKMIRILRVESFGTKPKPALSVAYNPNSMPQNNDEETPWSWELRSTTTPNIHMIVLGPRDPKTKLITPVATYIWDSKTSAYIGPAGSVEEKFLRLTDPNDDSLKQVYPLVGLDPNAAPRDRMLH